MTTSINDILYFVGENCPSVHFTELDRLLKKLDHEDLDVLRVMIEESYDTGHCYATQTAEARLQEEYNRGYEDGYAAGPDFGE